MTIPQYVRRLRMERAAGYGKKKLEIAVATRSRLLQRLFFCARHATCCHWGYQISRTYEPSESVIIKKAGEDKSGLEI
jgi:hypothetical protein